MTDAYTAPQSDLAEPQVKLGAVTEEMVSALRGTKSWVFLIGILMLIGSAFMVIGAFGMLAGGALMGSEAKGMPQGMFTGMGVMYLVMALLYVLPAVYLLKYASAIGRLVNHGRAADMEAALHQQRKFWKFVGVMTLIGIVLMVLGIIAAIAMRMAMHR